MKRSEFYRNFSLGLVYPAVLGSLIFQLLEYSNKKSMNQDLYSFKLTVLTFLVVIYSLDYLKNSFEKYSLTKLVFDFITVFGLFFSYSSLNFNSEKNDSVHLIQLSFAYFMLVGLENTWIFTKYLFFHRKSEKDELTKKNFDINRIANMFSFICAGTFMFGPLKFTHNKDYQPWLIWFEIVSILIIISELIRIIKLAKLLTIKD